MADVGVDPPWDHDKAGSHPGEDENIPFNP